MGHPRYEQTPANASRLFALSHDLMGALDVEGRLVWTNPAWEHMLGRTAAELAGTPYLELLHPDDRERALAVQADLAAGRTTRPELGARLRTAAGADVWVLFNAVYSPEERLLADDVPPVIEWDGLPVVTGDPAQLVQLFQNLIGNGVKFVAPGVQPRVAVHAARDDERWRFTVEDNGIGIEPRHAERVFGMFQRLHTRDVFDGTGIGLAIARKVVERHGGEISAEQREGGGSRLAFTLPVREEDR